MTPVLLIFPNIASELNGKSGHHRAWCYRTPCCQIAEAFGAHVIYYSASGQPAQNGYTQVDLDTLLTTSDIIYCPCSPESIY